jgi:hypothetical protein
MLIVWPSLQRFVKVTVAWGVVPVLLLRDPFHSTVPCRGCAAAQVEVVKLFEQEIDLENVSSYGQRGMPTGQGIRSLGVASRLI